MDNRSKAKIILDMLVLNIEQYTSAGLVTRRRDDARLKHLTRASYPICFVQHGTETNRAFEKPLTYVKDLPIVMTLVVNNVDDPEGDLMEFLQDVKNVLNISQTLNNNAIQILEGPVDSEDFDDNRGSCNFTCVATYEYVAGSA